MSPQILALMRAKLSARIFLSLAAMFLVTAALGGLIFAAWPLSEAGYFADDYTMLALVRHSENPLWFFVADPFFTYMYRPVGMSLWWISEASFGNLSVAHYVINLVLHAAVACGLGLLVHQATRQTRIAVGAGVLFALNPGTLKVATWLSARFDLLAGIFTLFALIAAGRAISGRGRWWEVLLLVTAAALSKEVTLLLLPLLALRIWNHPGLTRQLCVKGYKALCGRPGLESVAICIQPPASS